MSWEESTQYKKEIAYRAKIAREKEMPCKVLLSVIGKTPQIVTETIYALAMDEEEPWIPDEIIILTTNVGAIHTKKRLIDDGIFAEFAQHIRAVHPAFNPKFDESSIRTAYSYDDKPLDDIVHPRDNEAVADFIVSVIRDLTVDDNVELHVSMAGGRKTMGFFAGYGLSIFGRDRDRLSHVLVQPEFENHPEFFYPGDKEITLRGPSTWGEPQQEQKKTNTKHARLELANIPFAKLSYLTNIRELITKTTYGRICKLLQGEPHVAVDMNQKTITLGGTRIFRFNWGEKNQLEKLEPDPAVFYILHLIHAKKGWGPVDHEELCQKTRAYHALYDLIHTRTLKQPSDRAYNLENIHIKRLRVNETLERYFPDGKLFRTYKISPDRGHKSEIFIDSENISFPDIDLYAKPFEHQA